MEEFFVFITGEIDPFVTFMRMLRDQGAALNKTFTQIKCALLLNFTLRFFMIIKGLLNPKYLLQRSQGNRIPADTQERLIIQSLQV